MHIHNDELDALPEGKSTISDFILAGVALVVIAGLVLLAYGGARSFRDDPNGLITSVQQGGLTYELRGERGWDNTCEPKSVTIDTKQHVEVQLGHSNTGQCPHSHTNAWLQVGDYNADGIADFRVVKDSLNGPLTYYTYLLSPATSKYTLSN